MFFSAIERDLHASEPMINSYEMLFNIENTTIGSKRLTFIYIWQYGRAITLLRTPTRKHYLCRKALIVYNNTVLHKKW